MTDLMARVPVEFFVALFPVFWCLVNALVAHQSGWRALAERFRSEDDIDGECFRFVSGSMGTGFLRTNYSGCLFLVIGRRGIRLSTFFLFRPFPPPLFIPWDKIVGIRKEVSWFFSAAILVIEGCAKPISIYGKAGDFLLMEFQKQSNVSTTLVSV